MASPSTKILVFGATGVIGKVLIKSLLNAGGVFDKIGLFTSSKTATEKAGTIDALKSRGVNVFVGDVDNDDDVLEAYKGFDTIVSAVGRNAIAKQIRLIRLAETSSNIIRFFPSEYGTDIAYDETSANELTHQQKLKVREFLESDPSRRLKYTYLVTGPFADLYVGYRPAEKQAGSFDVGNREATLLGDGNGKISLTTMADVGRLLVGALKHPDFSDNKALIVNSFTTTPNAILSEIERQTESKWSVGYTSLNKLREYETQAWEEKKPSASLYTLRRIWTEGRTLYESRDNEKIGVDKTDTLEMVVQEVVRTDVQAF
ncbi:Isoflavone reductase [Geosmithia morbida]|uniref:Isoflavone reductase n=1 Tax=Geosmithia morbida TaxID=1094350 RepID=A0A9P4Z427_9HYPO|nr:Isoflavone reductase [Geosmithia morbida]KAF4126254.1 Isoflavone reductase [Geosmithia morbida]